MMQQNGQYMQQPQYTHQSQYGLPPQYAQSTPQYAQDNYSNCYGQDQQQFAGGSGYDRHPHEDVLTVRMEVPEGAVAGTKLQCTAPDGQELRLTVPEGVPPGSIMTLTQDPVNKQWKCMAEPADDYDAPLAQEYGYQPPPAAHAYSGGVAPAERIFGGQLSYTGSGGAATQYLPTGQAPTVITRSYIQQGMPPVRPVNLSYVPPPIPQDQYSAPATLAVDPQQFNPRRQYPGLVGGEQVDQRSYTPPPMQYTAPPVNILEQRPSYTPLPCVLPQAQGPMMGSTTQIFPQPISNQLYAPQRPPSYVPPPVMPQNPSYVPLPMYEQTPQGPSSVQLPPQGMMYMLPQQQQPPPQQVYSGGFLVSPPTQYTGPQSNSQYLLQQPQMQMSGTAYSTVGPSMPMQGFPQQQQHGANLSAGFGLQPPSMLGVAPLGQPPNIQLQRPLGSWGGVTRYGPDGAPIVEMHQQPQQTQQQQQQFQPYQQMPFGMSQQGMTPFGAIYN